VDCRPRPLPRVCPRTSAGPVASVAVARRGRSRILAVARAISSAGRAAALHAVGRGFESLIAHQKTSGVPDRAHVGAPARATAVTGAGVFHVLLRLHSARLRHRRRRSTAPKGDREGVGSSTVSMRWRAVAVWRRGLKRPGADDGEHQRTLTNSPFQRGTDASQRWSGASSPIAL
jgi:hypothetical protein